MGDISETLRSFLGVKRKPTVTAEAILYAFMDLERPRLTVIELQNEMGHSQAHAEIIAAANKLIEDGILKPSKHSAFVGYELTDKGYERLRAMQPQYE